MPTRPVLRAIALTAVLLTAAGCGSSAASPPAGTGPASPSPASQSPSAASPGPSASVAITPGSPLVSPTPGGSCHSVPSPGATITLHNSSNGGTFCVSIGQRVLVRLDSKPSRMWSPIRSDSRALVPLAYGHLMLRVGGTGAYFAAVHPGVAHLSSARPLCASGPVHCGALMAFQVTVMVGGMQASPVH